MNGRSHRSTMTTLALCTALAAVGCSDSDSPTSLPAVDAGITDGLIPDPPVVTETGGEEETTTVEPTTDTSTTQEPMPVDPAEIWRGAAYEGTLRGRLVGNDDLAITVTRELREQGFLTAVNPANGEELWRLPDAAFTNCVPVVLASGDVVAHLDNTTVAGGEDRSDDLALIDGTDGTVKDTYEPGNAPFANCGTGGLLATDSGIVIHAIRGVQTALSTSEDSIDPLWTRNWGRDFDDDALSAGRSPSFYDPAVVVGDRLYMGASEDHADGFENGVTLYRIDATTGAGVSLLELPLRVVSGIHVAGPGKLLVIGRDKDRSDATAVLVGGADADVPDGPLVIDWTRIFDGNGDGVTRVPSSSSIALSDGAFASWSAIDAGSTVTEFDLATGQANWSALTSSFENDETIVALPGGGYAVYPFGGNFLDAFDENGDPLWEIRELETSFVPEGMSVLAGNIVMSGRTDDGWTFLGVGPLR